jgi:hypothetical protein
MECMAVIKRRSGDIIIEPLGITASISEATRNWQLSHHGVSLLAVVRTRYKKEVTEVLSQDFSGRGHLAVVKRSDDDFCLEVLGPGKDMLSASRNWMLQHFTGAVNLIAILKGEYLQEVFDALSN